METTYIEDIEGLDRNNFWFRAKERYLSALIRCSEATILDVGCGTGRNLESFINRGLNVSGIDINATAVQLCRKKGYTAYQADLERDIPQIPQKPHYITALDFLEHVSNPIGVFKNLIKISRPETQLIVTVPAYPVLFSRWDRAMGHVKRYTISTLCQEMAAGGWELRNATYIHFLPLIPAIIQRRVIQPLREKLGTASSQKQENFFNPHPLMNRILYVLYLPEFMMFRLKWRLPFGLSVLAAAVPKPECL